MDIKKTDAYTLIKSTEDSVKEFVDCFKQNYLQLSEKHIIIDFSEKINTEIKDLLLFLKISSKHRTNGYSFVIICNGIEIDDIPDEINVVPTFTEALDILEMDAIERDLGF
ncbi:ribonuclease Z [Lutibacter sp.]|uniref:ribonuclease Z n=1 Tax=Lutibacter sp. TaxID=1925666 RepID=UPI001A19506F|nr:ribonuclease Z [Lutibacter sp.]MBI9040698.1 ribonuclease Z [Lutibacter sp.]